MIYLSAYRHKLDEMSKSSKLHYVHYNIYSFSYTGLSRRSDITQLAAYDGSEIFNKYVMPRQPISTSATAITGLSFDFTVNQMYHHDEPVNSEHLYTVLLDFLDFLRRKNKPILFGHNIAAYDVPILLIKLQENNLLSEFLQHITGCIDTLKLSKKKVQQIRCWQL
jgi:DNA polymerase III epsilon subunit-like protein